MGSIFLSKSELEVNSGNNTISSKTDALLAFIEACEQITINTDSPFHSICGESLDDFLYPAFDKYGFRWLYDAIIQHDVYRNDFAESAIRFVKLRMNI